MKKILAVVVLAFLCGCASKDVVRSPKPDTGLVPVLGSSMTVDQFVAAIRSGKTMQELRPRLGLPVVGGGLTAHYSLADGHVSETASGTKLTVRRNGSDRYEVIRQATTR